MTTIEQRTGVFIAAAFVSFASCATGVPPNEDRTGDAGGSGGVPSSGGASAASGGVVATSGTSGTGAMGGTGGFTGSGGSSTSSGGAGGFSDDGGLDAAAGTGGTGGNGCASAARVDAAGSAMVAATSATAIRERRTTVQRRSVRASPPAAASISFSASCKTVARALRVRPVLRSSKRRANPRVPPRRTCLPASEAAVSEAPRPGSTAGYA